MDRRVERCNNFRDPISLESIVEIPEKYLYRIKCGNVINCYDIRQLSQWLLNGHDNDPLCEHVLPYEIRRDIYLKYHEINNRERNYQQPNWPVTHPGPLRPRGVRGAEESRSDPIGHGIIRYI